MNEDWELSSNSGSRNTKVGTVFCVYSVRSDDCRERKQIVLSIMFLLDVTATNRWPLFVISVEDYALQLLLCE